MRFSRYRNSFKSKTTTSFQITRPTSNQRKPNLGTIYDLYRKHTFPTPGMRQNAVIPSTNFVITYLYKNVCCK